ncbi:endothelin-converting enzyme isoform X3 [Apis mellifera caucasica]|nr:endothelin-converting enzyme isoform X3 [Apis mellifera caucasica]
MARNTKKKLAIFAGTSKCLIYAEAKYCASEMPGEIKYYECPRTEYCCGIGCCVSPGLHFHHLWYYWILVIIMFLVCSGGGWWYRYWLQGRYRAAASAIPTRVSNSRAQNSLRGGTMCQGQRARITYNSARNTVLLHRMWKGPQRNGAIPTYSSNNATTSTHYQNMSVMLNDANCPYYQLYGPPPSYETVMAQTRGKVSNPASPESTNARSSNVASNATNSNMMMYKQAEFEDEDSSSIGSVALNSEGISTSATHIRYNSMSWVDYFKNATRIVNKKINDKMMIVNFAPEYFIKLSNLVLEYNKTNEGKVILNNYLVWQTVKSLTTCLSKPFRDAYKGLRKALIGLEGQEQQWRYCVSDTHNAMGFAIGAMFVREVFHGKSKPMAEKMIDQIRKAFTKNFKNLDWMDPITRRAAEEKANAITDMVGFPNFILNPSELDERYKDLTIKQNEYFQNNIRVNKYNLRKNLEKLDQPVNRTTWIMTPPTVNAYYWPTKNQMVFPAGILQSPFYDMENPNSLNFGGIGVVMGHELTHAFDDQGREYDLHGNLNHWWNNATIERFKNRTKCFVEQYSNFEINGRHVNGLQTLGENIADNGGLKAAYHAYLSIPKSYKDQLPLPGLNLTHRQLFFLNFAQVWCSAIMSEAVALQIEKDAHCPSKYRVIGSLSNLPEFAAEFNCPEGSRMNPVHKCEVW